MQQVNTFDSAFEANQTADDRAAHGTGLGRAIRNAWARLLEPPTSDQAVAATQEVDEFRIADEGRPGILANYYEGAYDRVKAAEPVVSFRKLAR
jgi:hypothetical protein